MVEGPTSSWGLRNRITLLTLQEHDDDDDEDCGGGGGGGGGANEVYSSLKQVVTCYVIW